MLGTPFVSIIMPVFNTQAYVREAIESIIAQTFDDWELIVVDDGSTDRSREVVEACMNGRNLPIRLVTHSDNGNHGANASRNRGLEFARGAYVAYLDSDDVWLPNKLEDQAKLASQHPTVSLFLGATCYWYPEAPASDKVIAVGGPQDQIVAPPQLFHALYPIGTGSAPSVNTILVKREALIRVGGWDTQFRSFTDQAFFVKFYLSEPVFISSSVYDRYRQNRAGSIMNLYLTGQRFYSEKLFFLRWLKAHLAAEHPHAATERALVEAAVRDPRLWFFNSPIRYELFMFARRIRNRIARALST